MSILDELKNRDAALKFVGNSYLDEDHKLSTTVESTEPGVVLFMVNGIVQCIGGVRSHGVRGYCYLIGYPNGRSTRVQVQHDRIKEHLAAVEDVQIWLLSQDQIEDQPEARAREMRKAYGGSGDGPQAPTGRFTGFRKPPTRRS